ncbi:Phage integrase family protein [Octadecabacter temperatus]|uniref:Phage integrase family protein n=1 Tax=Octadecabacter temperatus TaxID=1458307 RepID=A0A0K0Y4E9_9RHOB|nr:site-specific integrase [Octadecabacter temperatus]AKS45810.1 Phage integrase family protein [Octadecabacter temperatus]SIO01040.1 Phage integrase family protein [Octadecabacter temperatus]
MATFRERTLKSGKTSVTAQIVRRNPPYQESRTFDKPKPAKAWAKKREEEIDAEIRLGLTPKKRSDAGVTLGDAIDKYIKESLTAIGKTKAQVLRTIRTEYDIAGMPCDKIESKHIVTFVKELHDRPDLNSSATALNYLSHLAAVFSDARPLWGYELDAQAMKDAQRVLTRNGHVSKAEERTRRPTLDELDKLMAHFQQATESNPRTMPMHNVVAFAIFSTRRQAEICRITWEDFEPDHHRVLVRKMKNPGQKGGVDTWVELPDPCTAIIEAMPRKKEKIFPYNGDTVSRRFTEACKLLDIHDLHFHDLRHEGASYLAEKGLSVPQLAAVTGHKAWKSLERYTHVRERGDKYASWKWINEVT